MASSTRIANRYASALMNQAKADGTLETVSKDFQVIMNAVNARRCFLQVFHN
ncbi:MAG: hypothetical protein RL734_1907 [Bacteroidota bacterium]